MNIKRLMIFLLFLSSSLFALSPKELAKKLSLSPASKAMRQWERIFKSDRKMKRYGIDGLSDEDKKMLKKYLIEHSADSDAPELAGGEI
jgi:hypothetical protein